MVAPNALKLPPPKCRSGAPHLLLLARPTCGTDVLLTYWHFSNVRCLFGVFSRPNIKQIDSDAYAFTHNESAAQTDALNTREASFIHARNVPWAVCIILTTHGYLRKPAARPPRSKKSRKDIFEYIRHFPRLYSTCKIIHKPIWRRHSRTPRTWKIWLNILTQNTMRGTHRMRTNARPITALYLCLGI